MATVEEVIQAAQTSETTEKQYRSMERAFARGDRHKIDPAKVEASGRFMVDALRDADGLTRRYKAVETITEAMQRLADLRANPPAPAPTRETPLSEFSTLGELAVAIKMLNTPGALWGPSVDHKHAVTEAEGEIKRAQGHLRATSALSIDEQIRAARATIERAHQASDARVQLQERLATLKATLDRANPRSEQERSEVMSQRREHSELAKKLDGLPDVDREAAQKAGDEIERLTASQLLPENLQFSEPSGKTQGIYPTPCRFS